MIADALGLQDARARIAQLHQLYDAEESQRWRHPANGPRRDAATEFTGSDPLSTGVGAPARGYGRIPEGAYPLSTGPGAQCTINGQPGTLQREGNWLVCRPTNSADEYEPEEDGDQSEDHMSVGDAVQRLHDARQRAYEAYDREQQQAWVNPK
jgi:hypothetical protein